MTKLVNNREDLGDRILINCFCLKVQTIAGKYMRILICGATGNIGRLTVGKALKAGHEVTAFTRNEVMPLGLSLQKLKNKEHLYKAQGDVMDADSVAAAMANQDVVLAVFGAPPNWSNITSVPNLCTVGTRNILKIRLDTGSNGFDDNAANVLEPNFGSILNYSDSPPRDDDIGIGRLYYSFRPSDNLEVAIGPAMVATDYIDFSQYTRPSFRGISTESLAQNYILFPIEGPSAGAFTSWTFKEKFTIRGTYNAAEAANPNQDVGGIIEGLSTFTALLYGGGTGDGGLFGDFYQGMVELEYAPVETAAIRLQYSGGEVFDSRFDVLGVNAEWQFIPRLAVFGRYGYGGYDDTAFGNINPNYWMAGLSFTDLLKEGATQGIAAGQPFIVSEIGDDTQTNFEAYYNYPITDFISITPIFQVITNASNQSANDPIYTGTIRSVFNF